MPYLGKDRASNFTNEKLIINTEQHTALSRNEWQIIIEDLSKNYKYLWNGNDLNATKINITIKQELGGSGKCHFGAMGSIKAELIYAENIDRIIEQTIEKLGCSLNGQAANMGTNKLKLVDYRQ